LLLRSIFDVAKIQQDILLLEKETQYDNFWQDDKKASDILKQLSNKKDKLADFNNLEKSLLSLEDFSKETSLKKEEIDFLEKEIGYLDKKLVKKERFILFSGPFDSKGTILSIYAGAGGVDAQDWAEMLLRMYLRYSEKNSFKATIIAISQGDEAGLKSVTLEIKGEMVFGFLKNESGVHRLVRLSPFNAQNLRQTSFALVDVIPEVDEKEIEIDPKDLKIETFRSSGAGGQHVNVTDSAVRITHLPTKITASSQSERSQLQNKNQAMKVLSSKLAKYQAEKNEAEKAKLRGEISSASWGNQIRSYVLHPYKMVKDHRTGFESKNPEAVLSGELDNFIEESLKKIK